MPSLNCCSARNANQFTVSVNIEPEQKIFFNLTYEELLSRRKGIYEHVKQNFNKLILQLNNNLLD